MIFPWDDIGRDEYVRLLYEIAPLIGFNKRTYIESGPHSEIGYDIVAIRDNDILPGLGYPEKWLLAAVPYTKGYLKVDDIEFIKRWADEPLHEVDYILIVTPSKVSNELEDWFLKFNRFPIKKYKFKFLSGLELDHIVLSNSKIMKSFFGDFEPSGFTEKEKLELKDLIVKRLLNFRSDLGIVDIYLNMLFNLPEETQKNIISRIADVWSTEGFESIKRWNSGWILIRLAKLKPEILPIDVVERVSSHAESIYKAQAAHIYAWLSSTKPELVNTEILAKLLDDVHDYFVYVPVTKAFVNLIEVNEETFNHILALIKEKDVIKRYRGTKILLAISDENPMLVPPSVVKELMGDDNPKIREIAKEIGEKVLSFWEAPLRAQFNEAMEKFEKKDYAQASQIFSSLSKKAGFSLADEAKWWAGYCFYLERNYYSATYYFQELLKIKGFEATGSWWLSNCYERLGNKELATSWVQETARILSANELNVRIAPNKELTSEEVRPLLLKRLKELS